MSTNVTLVDRPSLDAKGKQYSAGARTSALESERYKSKSHLLWTSDKALGKFISSYLTINYTALT